MTCNIHLDEGTNARINSPEWLDRAADYLAFWKIAHEHQRNGMTREEAMAEAEKVIPYSTRHNAPLDLKGR